MTSTRFSAQDRRNFRRQLRELIDRLTNGVSELEAEALRPGAESTQTVNDFPAHEADRAVRETEEGVARTLLANEEHLLNEAHAAIERIVVGTFGVCEHCGHGISKTRLNAVPYTRFCIDCAKDEETFRE